MKGKGVAETLRRETNKQAFQDKVDEMVIRYQITEDFDELQRTLKGMVRMLARGYAQRYQLRGLRVYPDDFESEFWKVAYEMALEEHFTADRQFYKALRMRLTDRAKNIIRHFMTDKHKALTVSKELITDEDDDRGLTETKINKSNNFNGSGNKRTPMPSYKDTHNTEDGAINNVIVDQMEKEETLTDEERRLFKFMREDPDCSLQEIADLMGFSNKMKVSRMILKLREKLAKHYYE